MEKALAPLKWRSIGPAVMGGRTVDIAGIPGDASTVYMATASGGLFQTTNHGTTWRSVFETGGSLSLGAVAIAPSDRNVVYIGTGENNPRNSASIGDGVYKSLDAGRSWSHVGLADTEKTARIRIHPTDPDVVYVASLGHEWGANEERGVFRSRDGGASWDKVLYVDENTGASDLAIDPENPRFLYAGMYDFRRFPWGFRSGGPGSGLYRSRDGGDTWEKLTDPTKKNGLPEGPLGRIGISIAPSDPRVVYAVIEAKTGVMWRSPDRGDTWTMVTEDKTIHSRPFYFSDIRVDPRDENRVYLLEGALRVTEDAGRTWKTTANTLHGDHQALWIDPLDPNRLVNGNDGGWGFSYDRGETWEFMNTVPIGQFYQITADMQDPYQVCGGLQDNHVWCGPSNNLTNIGILNGDWVRVHPGGDGYYVQVDPTDPNVLYTNTHYGNIMRVDRRTGNARSIHPLPIDFTGAAAGEYPYRFNWNSPILLSPHDPNVVYFGSNVLFKTTNGGQSWDAVSPDLTTNDPEKIQVSGGEITPDNTSAEYHCAILTIAESPITRGLLWVGTDDGKIQVSRDGGGHWEDVTGNVPGQSPAGWVSRVEAGHYDPGTAYASIDRHRTNDPSPHVFETIDFGKTWKDITGNLPARGYVHTVREDPRQQGLLYVGTEYGVYGSANGDDAGREWFSLRSNLPPVAVRDVFVHPRDNDLVLATHGRSVWILDDATPIQRLSQVLEKNEAAVVFPPRTATRWFLWNRNQAGYAGQHWLGDRTFYGENPPYGAIVDFYVKEDGASAEMVKVAIRDASGKILRSLEAPATAGVHRVIWDLREEPLPKPKGVAADGFNEHGAPLVLPGRYSVSLTTSAGESPAQPLDVRLDPRISMTEAEARAQYEAARRLTDMERRIIEALETIESVDGRLGELLGRLKESGKLDELVGAAGEIQTSLGRVKSRLVRSTPGLPYRSAAMLLDKVRQLREGGGNYPGIEGAFAPPTDAQSKWVDRFEEELGQLEAEVQGVLSGPLAELNRSLSAAGVPHVPPRS
jgi:photosystem II stability/assembly factor-like uncharacterized protein